MARNVKRFARDLAEYINGHIVGNGNTVITHCLPDGPVMNRGKSIPIQIKIPDDLDLPDEMSGMGPAFYAEELMSEFPDRTVAAIAEIVNMRVFGCYDDMLAVMRSQAASSTKDIDDYAKDELILTALPTGNAAIPEENRTSFVMRDLPEIGITLTVKGALCDSGGGEGGQTYFTPVLKPEGREIRDEDWENAEANSLGAARLQFTMIPISLESRKGIPVGGTVKDLKAFYDWFYLVSPKKVWDDIVRVSGAERIWIGAKSAYEADFMLEFPDSKNDKGMIKLKEVFLHDGCEDAYDNVYIMDCKTYALSVYEPDTGSAGIDGRPSGKNKKKRG